MSNQKQKSIPEGWRLVKLGMISDVSAGGTPSTEKAEYWIDGDIPWANSAEINKKNIFDTRNFISHLGLKNSSAKMVPKNSVLIALAGQGTTRGKVAVNKIPLTTNQSVAFFVPKNELEYRFLRSNLERRYQELRSISAGDGGRGGLNLQILKSLKILLPPLPEQKRIVVVLETWDRAIEKLTQKIEIKKQIKKGLMQELLTGKKRLPGFRHDWNRVKLDEVINFINGYTFKSIDYRIGGKYKIITIANVQDGFMLIDEPKTLNELPSNISKDQILKKGDILISMTGNVGRICIVNTDDCLLNQRVGKIKPKGINKNLLYFLLLDRRFLSQMIDRAQGGAQANLSTGSIKRYSFYIPESKEEQDLIAQILISSHREIENLEKKLNFLKEQKKYLLNNLITGAIRTPESMKIM